MGDDYLPEQVDSLNLPRTSQSGNADVGHISQLTSTETQSQAGVLNNILNDYYGVHESFSDLQTDLREAGYSDQQITDISSSAHEERVFRLHHTDAQGNPQPSDLTPNQLLFLNAQGPQVVDSSRQTIHTEEDGRQYLDDYRVRDGDGNPSKLYLPTPIQFNPLTATQQLEASERQDIIDSIDITPDMGTGESVPYSEDQRAEISRITFNYFNSRPENRDEARNTFRHNIQQIGDLSAVDNIQDNLYYYFLDVETEYDHRIDNIGRPQLVSELQYDHMRQTQNGNYLGQPVYVDTTHDLLYFYGPHGDKVVIPSDDDITNRQSDQIDRPYSIDSFGPNAEAEINLQSHNFLTNPVISREQIINSLNDYFRDPTDPFAPARDDRYNIIADDLVDERNFRLENDGRPSNLSPEQYEYIMNHTLAEGENRYEGEAIIQGDRNGQPYLYYIDINDLRTQGSVNPLMSGQASMSRLNEEIMLPSSDMVQGFIDGGQYTPLDQRIAELQDPQPTTPILVDPRLPSVRGLGLSHDIVDPTIHQLPIRPQPIDESELLDIMGSGEIPEFAVDPLGIIDSIDDIILPDEMPSHGLVPLTTEENEYKTYYDSYQNLFVGFIESFKDSLPIVSGLMGGSFGFQLSRMRNRNSINDILVQEQQLLSVLETRTATLITNLRQEKLKLDSLPTAEYTEGVQRLNVLDLMRNTPIFANIMMSQYGTNLALTELQRLNPQVLQNEMDTIIENLFVEYDEIGNLETIVDELQFDIKNTNLQRSLINTRIQEIVNADYSILTELYNSYPAILSGYSIGHTLGYVLMGQYFPTYVDIETETEIVEENQKKEVRSKTNLKKEITIDNTFNQIDIAQHNQNKQIDISNQNEELYNSKQLALPTIPYNSQISPYQPINNTTIRKAVPTHFIPIKNNGNKPLNLKEINELKSTLNKSELKGLQNKYLIFGDNNSVRQIDTTDKCKNLIGSNEIFKRPIKIR